MTKPFCDILVVGAGPAGCCAALGLRRLGYQVALVHSPRPWPSCEGISERTLQGLRSVGLSRALSQVGAATPRRASWSGLSNSANSERLLLRRAFDAALLEDARAAGVDCFPARLQQRHSSDDDHLLQLLDTSGSSRELRCQFLVDARGRAAPRTPRQVRGPATVALVQQRQTKAGAAGSWLASFAEGWAWAARTVSGELMLQLTVAADSSGMPKRAALQQWFEQRIASIPELAPWLRESVASGPIFARGSTSILQGELIDRNSIRLGDAAVAVDPLSGNGMFQSLSSALSAPAVINTLLQYPAQAALAMEFYRERSRQTFLRFARTGRDFYRLETRWSRQAFWRERQAWPDAQPSHSHAPPRLLGVETRPVLDGDCIRSRPVAITTEQPLGIWRVAGTELAPLLDDLPALENERSPLLQQRLAQLQRSHPAQAELVGAWLTRHALI